MKEPFEGLCIGSGGINGLYYLGILDYYHEQNRLCQVKYYSGTSVGSLLCLLLIIGYTPKDILVHVCRDDILSRISSVSFYNVINSCGLADINSLKKYIEGMVLEKINFIPTFQQLFDLTSKTLYCASYNLTDQKRVYFSHFSHPNTSVLDAVLCSCSVPFLFSKNTLNGKVYIDGAIFDPTPVSVILPHFDEQQYERILTVRYTRRRLQYKEETFLSYFNQILLAIESNMGISSVCKLTHFIEIESEMLPFIFNMETSAKIDLFLKGRKRAIKKYELKEKID